MSQHESDPGGLITAIPEATTLALRAILEPAERVTHAVAVVGCSLVLTDLHLLIVREGADHRPRSGVQRWRLDRALAVRTTPVVHGTGRIVIVHRGKTTSVFVSAGEWDAAETLLMEAHRLIHRSDPTTSS
jgi:hypothetical protein